MATDRFPTIEVIDLTHVVGGVDKQTRALQLQISQATSAMTDVARAVAPKDNSMTEMMMQMMSQRRSSSGPSSAPALPPSSTLAR